MDGKWEVIVGTPRGQHKLSPFAFDTLLVKAVEGAPQGIRSACGDGFAVVSHGRELVVRTYFNSPVEFYFGDKPDMVFVRGGADEVDFC